MMTDAMRTEIHVLRVLFLMRSSDWSGIMASAAALRPRSAGSLSLSHSGIAVANSVARGRPVARLSAPACRARGARGRGPICARRRLSARCKSASASAARPSARARRRACSARAPPRRTSAAAGRRRTARMPSVRNVSASAARPARSSVEPVSSQTRRLRGYRRPQLRQLLQRIVVPLLAVVEQDAARTARRPGCRRRTPRPPRSASCPRSRPPPKPDHVRHPPHRQRQRRDDVAVRADDQPGVLALRLEREHLLVLVVRFAAARNAPITLPSTVAVYEARRPTAAPS